MAQWSVDLRAAVIRTAVELGCAARPNGPVELRPGHSFPGSRATAVIESDIVRTHSGVMTLCAHVSPREKRPGLDFTGALWTGPRYTLVQWCHLAGITVQILMSYKGETGCWWSFSISLSICIA